MSISDISEETKRYLKVEFIKLYTELHNSSFTDDVRNVNSLYSRFEMLRLQSTLVNEGFGENIESNIERAKTHKRSSIIRPALEHAIRFMKYDVEDMFKIIFDDNVKLYL